MFLGLGDRQSRRKGNEVSEQNQPWRSDVGRNGGHGASYLGSILDSSIALGSDGFPSFFSL